MIFGKKYGGADDLLSRMTLRDDAPRSGHPSKKVINRRLSSQLRCVIRNGHHNSVVSSSFAGVLLHHENNHLYHSVSFCCLWFRATENDVENAFL